MVDTVFIRDLKLLGKHGVYDAERNVEQEFIIDIEAEIDTGAAAQSDKLEDTIDYVRFKTIAEEVIQNQSHYLVEKIGDLIANKILEDKRIQSVSVTIKKPTVLENGVPGVKIIRSQN